MYIYITIINVHCIIVLSLYYHDTTFRTMNETNVCRIFHVDFLPESLNASYN